MFYLEGGGLAIWSGNEKYDTPGVASFVRNIYYDMLNAHT
jgi:hypothetical protein